MKRIAKQVFSVFLVVLYLSGYVGIGMHHCEHMDCECTHVEGCFHFHSDDGCCTDTFSPAADQDCGDDVILPAVASLLAAIAPAEGAVFFSFTQVFRFHREAPPRAGVCPAILSVWRL